MIKEIGAETEDRYEEPELLDYVLALVSMALTNYSSMVGLIN